MRLRLGAVLLALAPLSLAAPPASGAIIDPVTRPAYLNIIVDSPTREGQAPTFQVQRATVQTDSSAIDLGVSPQVDCVSEWQQQVSFLVVCRSTNPQPVELNNETVVSGFRCENAAVRAQIAGPVPGEFVTGTITCGEGPTASGASCAAYATNIDLANGGFSGDCFRLAPNGPLPIRCHVDLSGVRFDNWQVTCYGTDP